MSSIVCADTKNQLVNTSNGAYCPYCGYLIISRTTDTVYSECGGEVGGGLVSWTQYRRAKRLNLLTRVNILAAILFLVVSLLAMSHWLIGRLRFVMGDVAGVVMFIWLLICIAIAVVRTSIDENIEALAKVRMKALFCVVLSLGLVSFPFLFVWIIAIAQNRHIFH